MKLLLLCLLPAVLSAPQDLDKRFFLDSITSLLDLETLKCDVQIILDVVGSDPTEKACEGECHHLLSQGHVLNFGCPLVCHALQNLAHYFHEVPKPGQQNTACGGASMTTTASG